MVYGNQQDLVLEVEKVAQGQGLRLFSLLALDPEPYTLYPIP